jgi:hypothetical protein
MRLRLGASGAEELCALAAMTRRFLRGRSTSPLERTLERQR